MEDQYIFRQILCIAHPKTVFLAIIQQFLKVALFILISQLTRIHLIAYLKTILLIKEGYCTYVLILTITNLLTALL